MDKYDLRINFQNACCNPARRMLIECGIREEVIRQAKGLDNARAMYEQPDRKTNPNSDFNIVFNSAVDKVLDQFDYSPSARHEAKIQSIWEVRR